MEKLRYLRTVRRVFAGLSFLVRADKDKIFHYFEFISQIKISFNCNPYRDGKSSWRIKEVILNKI